MARMPDPPRGVGVDRRRSLSPEAIEAHLEALDRVAAVRHQLSRMLSGEKLLDPAALNWLADLLDQAARWARSAGRR